MHTISIWALDDGLGGGVTGPCDVFAVANAIWRKSSPSAGELFRCNVWSVDGKPVQTAGGLRFQADGAIDVLAHADVVMLPGLAIGGTVQDVLQAAALYVPLLPALQAQHARGTMIAANCTSTVLLAEAGLLDRRIATTSWWLLPSFRQKYPEVDLRPDEVVTEDEGIFCSGASTAALHLALRIVSKLGTHALAVATARSLLIDVNVPSQSAYRSLTFREQFDHSDKLISRAQRWMQTRLQDSFHLELLVQKLNMSERTLIRRFKAATGETPVRYLQQLRIESAKRLIETTTLTIEQVCDRVGYGDVGAFRKVFKRETGVAPREYRDRFAARAISPVARF